MTNPQYFEINPNKQYQIAIDISGSMQQSDPACGGAARYPYALEKTKTFIKASESFDPDGPTILLFGQNVQVFENTTLDAVEAKLVAPKFEMMTQTHLVIREAWAQHQKAKAAGQVDSGTVLLLITDGEPTDRTAVKQAIVEIANTIDKDEEFSISFLTVGTIEPSLQSFLTMLDDDLKGAKHDIVDVKALESVDFLAAVAGAVAD